ncbi:MAG: DUF1836 domain-containing protein [Anaerovoracaceae bacterium]
MDELKILKQRMEKERPVEWSNFPDINLYKDQVVAYLKRQLIHLESEGQLTPAMISNYVKDKLLPKADGKKYGKKHLAVLTEISLLKQVLTVRDMGVLLQEDAQENNPEIFYNNFVAILDKALSRTASKIDENADEEDVFDLALEFAIESYCAKLACENLIGLMKE